MQDYSERNKVIRFEAEYLEHTYPGEGTVRYTWKNSAGEITAWYVQVAHSLYNALPEGMKVGYPDDCIVIVWPHEINHEPRPISYT